MSHELRELNDFTPKPVFLERIKNLGKDVLRVMRHEVPTTPEEAQAMIDSGWDSEGTYIDPELRHDKIESQGD